MKCVYCGKEYQEGGTKINVSNGVFDVCSSKCKNDTMDYLNKDKEYKKLCYILIFICSIGFIISMIFMPQSSRFKLVPMYIGLIGMGIVLAFLPYIFTSFGSFVKHSIKSMTLFIRLFGVIISIISCVFLFLTFAI